MSNELKHYGIPGMRKGIRRFQNEDGSLTAAGRARYGVGQGTDAGTGSYKGTGSVIKPGVSSSSARTTPGPSGKAGRATGYTDSGTGHVNYGYVARSKAASGDYAGAGRTVSAGVRKKARTLGSRLKQWWGRAKNSLSNVGSSVKNIAKRIRTAVKQKFTSVRARARYEVDNYKARHDPEVSAANDRTLADLHNLPAQRAAKSEWSNGNMPTRWWLQGSGDYSRRTKSGSKKRK